MVGSLLSEIQSNITFSFLFDVRTILLMSIDFLDKITEKSFLEIAESELYLHRDKYARKELQQKNVETPTSGREERITVVY